MADCPACGIPIDADVSKCPECGASVSGATASFQPVDGLVEAPAAAAASCEGPVLVVRKGPQPGEKFFLEASVLTIGRDPESDIFLNDMTVSRTHARVERVDSVVKVIDAGSLNGTYVNGVLVETAELKHGDIVQIGTFQMAFYCLSEGEDS
jgi:hypothetical protein